MTAPDADLNRNQRTGNRGEGDTPITRNPRTAAITRGRSRGRESPIRILIVDDHALLRQALMALLSVQDGVEVVGEAENGREAVEVAEELLPDVVLMDGVMPGLNGITRRGRSRRNSASTRVLMLTAYLEDERVLQALRAGASGYVMKNADVQELILAIQSVHRGNVYFSSTVAEELPVNEVLLQAKQTEGRTGYDLLPPPASARSCS